MSQTNMELSAAVALIERQKLIAIDIEKKRENAVKYGSKRTKEIYQRIYSEIQTLWSEFIENDVLLTGASAENQEILNQPYFKEKRKDLAEGLFKKAKAFILSHFSELESIFEEDPLDENFDDEDQKNDPEGTSSLNSGGPGGRGVRSSLEEPGVQNLTSDATHQTTAADALMKISEVLATQQQFQQLIQQQMASLMANQERKGLKPPRVDIPFFDGSQLSLYKGFKDTFLRMTSNSNLSKLEKLTLLKGKVTGNAANFISHITIAETNYDKTWKVLDDWFDDPVAIISNSVDEILDMPPVPPNDCRAVEVALNLIQGVANSLELLEVDPNQVFLIRAIIRKLSDEASGELTRFIGNHKEFPTYSKLIEFFIHHLSILRARNNSHHVDVILVSNDEKKAKEQPSRTSKQQKNQIAKSHATIAGNEEIPYRCYICFEQHLAPVCPKLASSENPYGLLKHYNICTKCASHKFSRRRPCIRKISCEICRQDHLTALHGKTEKANDEQPLATHFCSNKTSSMTCVLLPTAVTKFFGRNFDIEKRVLVDVCSQASYVEEQLCQALKLKKIRCNVDISGVGGGITATVKHMVLLKFQVSYPERRTLEVNAFVVKRVTRNLPTIPQNFRSFTGFDKPLADSFIGEASHVPVLLGANIAAQLFLDGTLTFGGLLLQNTRFGWMVTGSSGTETMKGIVSTHVSLAEVHQEQGILENLNKDLREFWDLPVTKTDIEEVEAEVCEDLFNKYHYQQADGRYVVPIPWKQDAPPLGNSYKTAVSCFLSQERRMLKDPTHKQMSDEFMKEYIALGHMSLIPSKYHGVTNGDVYYIPYHSILKKDSVTTKIRNVFNASAKTSTGTSLNQTIHPGPKLQSKIFDVITRIRQYRYIYSSDVTKMYRQILLRQEDRNRLRILYRENRNFPIQEYCLNTVTYGMDCAPWQAIRTMRQVAKDHSPSEELSSIISNSFYMDDLYHGADTIEDCQQQISQLIDVLDKGKLPLTKWMANNDEILRDVEECRRLDWFVDLKSDTASTKTLGIQYFPREDSFGVQVKDFLQLKYTKRGMLSVTASLYDPLGFILPVIMQFRILLQNMWSLGVGWDDELESSTKEKFQKFISRLSLLEQLRIPRWICSTKSNELELVGFSDASGDGFAAVVYARTKVDSSYNVTLLAARGRVTPLKTKANLDSKLCTIPKMELEGLVLLSDLLKEVMDLFSNLNVKVTAYTDSKVVLAWVRKSEAIDNKFVQRRVAKIRKVLLPSKVHYVKSSDNPADAASRGLPANIFLENQQLWLSGPSWMKDEVLPFTPFEKKEVLVSNVAQVEENEFVTHTMETFSSIDKLIACVSVMLIWVQMFWKKIARPMKDAQQIADAKQKIISLQQQHSLQKEIELIRRGKQLKRGHWLSFLCPYLDKHGILRVGGRLNRAKIPRDQKNPILVPKSHLARLLIRDIHLKNDHAPNALTDRILKETYWVAGSRSIIKQEIRQCFFCLRFKANTHMPQMSDLPLERISSSPIFESTSVDFAGPFTIRASKMKFEKAIKVWVSVFVCMSTKLSHLEICTELSAENFLAAFERFTSRRSTPGLMVSDNGTNFVAANKHLSQQYKAMIEKSISVLATRQIKWTFIPPGSPHFGGLHEACVRSFKHFLKRMARIENLTYEEFNTVVCKIEGILNSRPLYPLSTDPNDELVLTPGHFAVQRCLKAPPSCQSTRKCIPITKKWILVQQLQTDFWEIYTKEYLSTLQKRYKWIQPQYNMKVDDVVIIKEHLTHPLDWPIGRVVKCYPDDKGTVRKVDVLNKKKAVVHRAVNKLIPILNEEDEKKLTEGRITTRSRSSRLKPSLLMLATLCLCFLSCPSIQAEVIEPLSPGIHIRSMGEVNVKTLNVLFSLQTNVNVTSDIAILDEQSRKFEGFCKSMKNVANLNNTRLCTERQEFLLKEATLAKNNILSSYGSSRAKKSLSMFSKFTMGAVMKKAGPYALVAAATGWQEYENYKTTQKVRAVEEKFNKVSFILLNITETETTSLQHQLDNLVNQQQQLILESETNGFAASIQSLISTVEARHQSLTTVRPMKEFEAYVSRLNSHSNIVRIPVLSTPNDIFTIHPIHKSITDGLVVLTYDIPLSRPEKFIKYAVISSPNEENEAIILENNAIVQMIVTNHDNTSYFFPDASEEIFPKIYDEVKLQFHDTCTSSLIRLGDPHRLCHTDNWVSKINLFPLHDEVAVVIKTYDEAVTLICGTNTTDVKPKSTIIHYSGCYMEGVQADVALSVETQVTEDEEEEPLEDTFNPLAIEQNTVHSVTKVLDGMKSQLRSLLMDNASSTTPNAVFIISIMFVVLVVIVSIFIVCQKSSLNSARDLSLQSWSTNQHEST